MGKLFVAFMLVMAMTLPATNLYDLTGDVLYDEYSDYTVYAYDFAKVKGSFAHTYLRDNNIALVASRNLGMLKPFIDWRYIPGGMSTFYTDMLEVDSNLA